MAFTDTLTLDDTDGTDTVYALQGRDLSGSSRINVATTASEPSLLVIKHSKSGANANIVDRHLVQFSTTDNDSDGIPRTAIVNLTLAVPRSQNITTTMITDLVSNLIDFVADGGFTSSGIAGTTALQALLRGES